MKDQTHPARFPYKRLHYEMQATHSHIMLFQEPVSDVTVRIKVEHKTGGID